MGRESWDVKQTDVHTRTKKYGLSGCDLEREFGGGLVGILDHSANKRQEHSSFNCGSNNLSSFIDN